jgi:glucose-1-phosphate cytidylyltransferase
MKVVILAGGYGTRFSEETDLKPKPMIEIGTMPILWHIMKLYSYYGFNDFIICLGYKGYIIKEYFTNYYLHHSNVSIDLIDNNITFLSSTADRWKITLIDTGLNTMTGARIKKIKPYIGNIPFMLTYGDGVSDININELLNFHLQHNKIATITAVKISGKFGALNIDDNNNIISYQEKPNDIDSWINGGFFVLGPDIFNYINDNDNIIFEREPLETIALENQLMAYKHNGFWKCMDTLRDKIELNNLWETNQAKWKIWE